LRFDTIEFFHFRDLIGCSVETIADFIFSKKTYELKLTEDVEKSLIDYALIVPAKRSAMANKYSAAYFFKDKPRTEITRTELF